MKQGIQTRPYRVVLRRASENYCAVKLPRQNLRHPLVDDRQDQAGRVVRVVQDRLMGHFED